MNTGEYSNWFGVSINDGQEIIVHDAGPQFCHAIRSNRKNAHVFDVLAVVRVLETSFAEKCHDINNNLYIVVFRQLLPIEKAVGCPCRIDV